MKDRQQLIADCFLIILTGAIILCAVVGQVRGDEADYLARAKAAIAINVSLSGSGGKTEVPVPTVGPPAKAAKRIVYLYTQAGCPPCDAAKVALAGAELPFTVIVAKPTIAVLSFPTFHWTDSKSKEWVSVGWNGTKHLVGQWQQTERTTVARSTYHARWTWPGSLSSHLRSTHGINPTGMSQDDMERAHDAAHEGKR